VRAQVDLKSRRVRLPFRIALFLFITSPSLLSAIAQHAHGRGAMSAQDMAKMSSAAGAKEASPHAATDPGTPMGTYTVVVTATAGSGSSQDQASVNVPITIQ
jgi:hypothetical protein